jgi:hypothetical protein
LAFAGKLEELSLDINRQMPTIDVISDMQHAQKVHGTDLAKLSARLDKFEGQHRGRHQERTPRHSSPAAIRSDIMRVRDETRPRQRSPVSNVLQNNTQVTDQSRSSISASGAAAPPAPAPPCIPPPGDLPVRSVLMVTGCASGLTMRPCQAHCTSSELHYVDEAGVQTSLQRQPGLSSLPPIRQRSPSPHSPPPYMATQAPNFTSATALAAPTPWTSRQSLVPPSAWVEQC